MASRHLSHAASRNGTDVHRERPADAAKSASVFRRILTALARAHCRTMRFAMARHKQSDAQMSTELEHQLSWRFGVPVR
jgi:hypothetical protein